MKSPTQKQAKYLAFIHHYALLHGRPPAEADMQRYFRVSPPSVHRMVVALHQLGLIERDPDRARSIRILVDPATLPPLDAALPGPRQAPVSPLDPEERVELAVRAACRAAARMIEHGADEGVDDDDLLPLLGCVADAVAEELRHAGIPEPRSATARDRILLAAEDRYVRLCAENDADESDPEEDAARFRETAGKAKSRQRRS